jgi:hypothetical protein
LLRDIAALEEDAQLDGVGRRYVLGVFAANEGADDDASARDA